MRPDHQEDTEVRGWTLVRCFGFFHVSSELIDRTLRKSAFGETFKAEKKNKYSKIPRDWMLLLSIASDQSTRARKLLISMVVHWHEVTMGTEQFSTGSCNVQYVQTLICFYFPSPSWCHLHTLIFPSFTLPASASPHLVFVIIIIVKRVRHSKVERRFKFSTFHTFFVDLFLEEEEEAFCLF